MLSIETYCPPLIHTGSYVPPFAPSKDNFYSLLLRYTTISWSTSCVLHAPPLISCPTYCILLRSANVATPTLINLQYVAGSPHYTCWVLSKRAAHAIAIIAVNIVVIQYTTVLPTY